MRRFSIVASACVLTLSAVVLQGCGSDNDVADIKQSAAATNADKAGQKAVEDMLKSKSTKKAAGASNSPAPGATPAAGGAAAPSPVAPK